MRRRLREVLAREGLRCGDPRPDAADDPRALYRVLGSEALLAVHWPPEHGGGGCGPDHLAVLVEELARHGVPHALYFLTIEVVGALLLQAGSDEQRRRVLPAMARGEEFACVLFTEPDAGSDLAAVATAARREGGGWVLDGHKRFSVLSSWADHGLCLARTGERATPGAFSVFLVPMRSPGVEVTVLPSSSPEQFHDVELRGVRLGGEALVGAEGQGLSLQATMLTRERSGLDQYARGLRWLELACGEIRSRPLADDPQVAAGVGRLHARLQAGRLLALRVLHGLAAGDPDVALASLAKVHCSEAAQAVATWVFETLGGDAGDGPSWVEEAYRMAPGLTVRGGASEVLLEAVAGGHLDGAGRGV